MMRRAMALGLAILAAFAPALALATGHCAAMTDACQGPCTTSVGLADTVPTIATPRPVATAPSARAERAAQLLAEIPHPPPRSHSLAA